MLSLSGDPRRAPFEPGLPGAVHFDDPYRVESTPGDLEEVLCREGPETVAAVLLEGVVGANGVFVPPPGYYRRVRDICDRHGVLFIADEVLSGFGRTGRWFAVDHDGVSPDMITCGKGLTAGYAPGGAVLVNERLARFFDDHVLSCGLTAYAHPITCAAIVAAIGAYHAEDLVERAARIGKGLELQLRAFARTRPWVTEVRGLGLLWAIELGRPGAAYPPATPETMARLTTALRRRHLHAHRREHLVYVAPPLVVTEAELTAGLDRLGAALDETFGGTR